MPFLSRHWIYPAFLGLGGLFLISLFAAPSFLHPESVVMSFWWTEPGFKFTDILFDPFKVDQHVGRFRYLTYLVEGTYWRLLADRLLPREFYDYLAIIVNLAIAAGIFQLGRQMKLSRFWALCLSAFFLFSCPVFMTSTWHCRKAKYLVSLELIAFSLLSFRARKKIHWGESVVAFLGVITDPYAILFLPVLALGWDLYHQRRPSSVLSLLVGYGLAFIFVCLLNGVIGPAFNPNVSLVFHNFQHIPETYFNVDHILLSPMVLTDLVAPWVLRTYPTAQLLLMPALLGTILLVFWKAKRVLPITLMFLISIPIAAFIFEPKTQTARYATYYGHPVLVLMVFSALELISTLKNRLIQTLTFLGILFSVGFHQAATVPVFNGWTQGSLISNRKGLEAYWNDLELIYVLQKELANPSNRRILQLEDLNKYKPEFGYVFPKLGSLNLAHHDLAYAFLPLYFRKEISEGRLRIEDPADTYSTSKVDSKL